MEAKNESGGTLMKMNLTHLSIRATLDLGSILDFSKLLEMSETKKRLIESTMR
jgi:hypothetical protein